MSWDGYGNYAMGTMESVSKADEGRPFIDFEYDPIAKAWVPRRFGVSPQRARTRAQIGAWRNEARDKARASGRGDQFDNYGIPHDRRFDGPVKYSTKVRVEEAVGREVGRAVEEAGKKAGEAYTRNAPKITQQATAQAANIGRTIGNEAEKALVEGGRAFGGEAGKSVTDISRNARRTGRNIGLGITGAGVLGGGAYGFSVRHRRNKKGHENVVLNRKTGKFQVT